MRRYRPYQSSQRSRAVGNQRAANQQRDTCQVVLKSTLTRGGGQNLALIDKAVPSNEKSWVDTGTIAVNIYDVILRSEFYENYSGMYDQVRIDQVKVTVTPAVWTTSRTESPMPGYTVPKSLTIVTAWDRSGLSHSQFLKDPEDDDVYYCTIGEDIENYSSAVTKRLGPGSMFNITRFLYPSNEYERNQFVNCKSLKRQFGQYIEEPYAYELVDEEDITAPNNLKEYSAVGFKPTFLLGVRSPYKTFIGPNVDFYNGRQESIIAFGQLRATIFTLEFEVTVTFRGLRYDKII